MKGRFFNEMIKHKWKFQKVFLRSLNWSGANESKEKNLPRRKEAGEFALRLIDGFRRPETRHRITSCGRRGGKSREPVVDRAP